MPLKLPIMLWNNAAEFCLYYAQIMLHKSIIKFHKFTNSFPLSYLNYKIMSISSLSSLAHDQQFIYVYMHILTPWISFVVLQL